MNLDIIILMHIELRVLVPVTCFTGTDASSILKYQCHIMSEGGYFWESIWDVVAKMVPLYSIYLLLSYKPTVTLLASTSTTLAHLCILFIF